VKHAEGVAVLDGLDQLAKVMTVEILREARGLSTSELYDKENVGVGENDVAEGNDVGVAAHLVHDSEFLS